MKRAITLGTAIILVITSLILASCQTPASPLEDYTWVLSQYGEIGSINSVLPDTEITVYFDSQEKTVRGSGGCNTYSGEYVSGKASLSLPGPLAVTERACDTAINEQEAGYLEILQTAERFELEHGNLYIYSKDSMLFFHRGDGAPPAISHWGE